MQGRYYFCYDLFKVKLKKKSETYSPPKTWWKIIVIVSYVKFELDGIESELTGEEILPFIHTRLVTSVSLELNDFTAAYSDVQTTVVSSDLSF